MGCPTRVQLIKRKESEQWYVNFPSAIAQAIEFQRGEVVEWYIEDKGKLVLERAVTPPSRLKKTPEPPCRDRPALGRMPGGLRARRRLAKGQGAPLERPGVFGPPYRDGSVVRRRAAVSGLVWRLPGVFGVAV